jgi:hypothetical protein
MSPTDQPATPPAHECFAPKAFAERHPTVLNLNRVVWAIRNRRANGLLECGGVFESPMSQIFVHEPKFLQWLFGLSGRAKSRKLRGKPRRRSRAN